MAVAFDAVATFNNAATTSASWTHTPVGTPTGVAIVAISASTANGAWSATYGGVSLGSPAVTQASAAFGNTQLMIWGLSGPASGAQTVVVSQGGSSMDIAAASFTVTGGVTTGSPFSNTASNNNIAGANTTLAITSPSGELVVDIISSGGGATLTANGTGQVRRYTSSSFGSSAGSTTPGAGSTTVSYSNSNANGDMAAASFKAGAAAAAGETRPTPSFGPGNGPASGRRALQAFPASSTSATLTAAFGSFTETGIAATFDTALVATFGSFALTGADVQFVGGMRQVGTPVDYLFGPGRGPGRGLKPSQAFPDTVTSVALSAGFGSFVETGEPVTFDTGLAAAFASFAESGQAVTFDSRMAAAFGTFAETGVAASFDTALTAAFGSFALTGIDAQFVGGMPQVGRSADLLFAPGGGPTRGLRPTTAFPDTVPASITLTAGTGIYTETGEPVTFDASLAAAFGSFAETGQAITADTALNAAPGIFVLTGIDVTPVPTPVIPVVQSGGRPLKDGRALAERYQNVGEVTETEDRRRDREALHAYAAAHERDRAERERISRAEEARRATATEPRSVSPQEYVTVAPDPVTLGPESFLFREPTIAAEAEDYTDLALVLLLAT